MSQTNKTMEKLRAVEWRIGPKPADSTVIDGASAYLQKFAAFLHEWQADTSSVMPFVNPREVLGVGDLLTPVIAAEAEELAGQSANAYDLIYVKQALEWAALCDASHPATRDHEDMFDWLLNLVASRVPTGVRKGYWVVDENLFPLANWLDRYTSSRSVQ